MPGIPMWNIPGLQIVVKLDFTTGGSLKSCFEGTLGIFICGCESLGANFTTFPPTDLLGMLLVDVSVPTS